MNPLHIVILPGTNRKDSQSGKLAGLLVADYLARGCTADRLDLALGPEFLDPEVYSKPGTGVTDLVQRFLRADGVVFIVPEYNGSYPGVLKLFIDMLPYPQGFDQRPCAFVGLAAGQFQGLRAVEHLQGVSGYRQAHNFPVRVFIGDSRKAFTPEGSLSDPKLAQRLQAQADGFLRYIRQVRPPAAGTA